MNQHDVSATNVAAHGLNEAAVAEKAHSIWEREDRPHGEERRHWFMAIEHLLISRVRQLEAKVTQLQPQNLEDVWQQLRFSRHAIRVTTDSAAKIALNDRPQRGRDQGADNALLAPVSTSMYRALTIGDARLAVDVFQDAYSEILDHQQATGNEVHKGALAFDVASAYLRSWDFYAAMHYYELAEDETRETDNNPGFSIYNFDLFEKNFWDSFDYGTAAHTNDAYQTLWGVAYDKTTALADYSNLSPDSRLAYIIASSLRLRLQHLEAHSKWNGSNALRLGYWTLAADLARLLEVEANRVQATPAGGGPPPQLTIVPCLEQGFTNTAYGNLSDAMRNAIRLAFPRKDPPGPPSGLTPADYYEAAFDPLLVHIKDTSHSRDDRLSHALYLLGFTRNQVAHRIDSNTRLFQQLNDAKYLVDLFIALCRVDEWKSL